MHVSLYMSDFSLIVLPQIYTENEYLTMSRHGKETILEHTNNVITEIIPIHKPMVTFLSCQICSSENCPLVHFSKGGKKISSQRPQGKHLVGLLE